MWPQDDVDRFPLQLAKLMRDRLQYVLMLRIFSKEGSVRFPFLLPADWNADVMAGTRATLLVPEDKGHTRGQDLLITLKHS